VLLRAYFDVFTDADDVSLVLKTFPNPHNDVAGELARLSAGRRDAPHVVWIDRDLERRDIDGLYAAATCYVHAARGEGFGLPVAEAMRAGVPVISVDSTGLADFVSDDTAMVIGWRHEPARSHVSVPGSLWAEPDLDALRLALTAFARGDDLERRATRVATARAFVDATFEWSHVADRWRAFIRRRLHERPGTHVAAVTTFNSRCGIAEYTAHLYAPLGEAAPVEVLADSNGIPLDPVVEATVQRVWLNHRAGPVDELLAALDASSARVVHVQHNYGFVELSELCRIIKHERHRRPVIVTLHRTADLLEADRTLSLGEHAEVLSGADALVVHQRADVERLARFGLRDNVHLIQHGNDVPVHLDRDVARVRHGIGLDELVIGAFGFLLPHKGLIRLVESIALLRERNVRARLLATCALHPDPSSAAHHQQVLRAIAELGLETSVTLVTDFLAPDDARDTLACADVIAMPYDDTAESASGAMRFVLPLGRPLVTTNVAIFDDVRPVVLQVASPADPAELATAFADLWLDTDLCQAVTERIRSFANEHSWPRVAARTQALYRQLIDARSGC
jgi:glycosyltransferase involved in cell wall biosynthesis